jgi:alkylated DNA repair dioxygenase AlkB
MKSKPLSKSMSQLLLIVNTLIGTEFNGILVNKYMDGNDYISAHSDDETGLDSVGVVSISYGAERLFRIRDKETKKIVYDEITTHCSILHMGSNFQKLYTHEIPIQKKIKDSRISFTFRKHIV